MPWSTDLLQSMQIESPIGINPSRVTWHVAHISRLMMAFCEAVPCSSVILKVLCLNLVVMEINISPSDLMSNEYS